MKTGITSSEPNVNSTIRHETCYYNDEMQGEEAFLLFIFWNFQSLALTFFKYKF